MKRAFSLRRGNDFQRVWDKGKSWSHPLVIVRASPNGLTYCRFGFVAGKKLGKAVARNHAKRWLREVTRSHHTHIAPGFDLILIARAGVASATFTEVGAAVTTVLQRAGLISRS